ncbi:hypothetical protein MACK_004079 [Theileria orientalis]|uniref:Uncharacterized protein n=1 Tax=Theileria orientalis TaxID=68886 RepID=A0A976XJ09_THEOR|nr:hypothetical protein MACK_004079 [Theileria orientalis]
MKEPAKSAIDYLFENPQEEGTKQKVETLEKLIKSEKSNSDNSEAQTETNTGKTAESLCVQYCRERVGRDGIGSALSPLLLYWSSTMFKDFLFPATLPYGLLTRDKCHIINVMTPIFMNIGPVTFFVLDNFTDVFGCWSWYFDMFWVLFIPLPILLTFVLRAIFTRDPAARCIINSRPRVTCMTFMLMVSFGYMEPLSYMGLAKYAFRQNPGGFTIMGYHVTSAFLCRALFSKISVGFSDTRISLGYHLPKFRPTHRMSKKNLYMYLFKETFRRALRDFKGDFKLDIKKYL